jgi:hypothetical protein
VTINRHGRSQSKKEMEEYSEKNSKTMRKRNQ